MKMKYYKKRSIFVILVVLLVVISSNLTGCKSKNTESPTEYDVQNAPEPNQIENLAPQEIEAWLEPWIATNYKGAEPFSVWAPDALIESENTIEIYDRVTPEVWRKRRDKKREYHKVRVEKEDWKVNDLAWLTGKNHTAAIHIVMNDSYTNKTEPYDILIDAYEPYSVKVQKKRQKSIVNYSVKEALEAAPLLGQNVIIHQPERLVGIRGEAQLGDHIGEVKHWVFLDQMPPYTQRFARGEINIYDAKGNICKTRAKDVSYYSKIIFPKEFYPSDYNETLPTRKEHPEEGTLTREKFAATLSQFISDPYFYLAVKLDPNRLEGCGTPIFARAADLPETKATQGKVLGESDLKTQLLNLTAQLDLPSYYQKEFNKVESGRDWYDSKKSKVVIFDIDQAKYAAVTLLGHQKCNHLNINHFVLWKQTDKNSWEQLTHNSDEFSIPFVPVLAADTNADGSPEFFAEGIILGQKDQKYSLIANINPIDLADKCE